MVIRRNKRYFYIAADDRWDVTLLKHLSQTNPITPLRECYILAILDNDDGPGLNKVLTLSLGHVVFLAASRPGMSRIVAHKNLEPSTDVFKEQYLRQTEHGRSWATLPRECGPTAARLFYKQLLVKKEKVRPVT